MTNNHYILVGHKVKVVPLTEWAIWMEGAQFNKARVVKQETLKNGKWLSTVFLGLDYNFDRGTPLLFETMLFPSPDNLSEIACERCSTWKEAEAQHERMKHESENSKD